MKNVYRAVCAAVLTCWIAANADLVTIKLTGVGDGTTENFSVYTNPALPMSGPTIVNATAYTGLYDAKVLETGEQWKTYCIDPVGDINIGSQWSAQLLTSDQLSGGQGVLYQSSYGPNAASTAKEKYAMISYLANQYYYNSNSLTAAQRSDLSLAFWEIARDYSGNDNRGSMNLAQGNFVSTSSINSFTTSLLDGAFAHRDDAINMSVYNPTGRPSQEFIAFKVPEPGTIGLLLTGLITLCGLSFTRRGKTK
jgi:hypothetical protein